MKPKISIVSLSVRDVAAAVAFYRDGLGFPTHNYAEGDDYVMFRLEGVVALVGGARGGAD
jgi:uncharacterized protein